MPDESDYGVEIPPRDHGPARSGVAPAAGRCTPVVPANWPLRDDATPEETDQLRQTLAACRPAEFTLYGLPVVINPQVPSPRGIVFGPDIVPLAVRVSPEYAAAVDEATAAALRIMKEHNERLLGMATDDDADAPHVVES